MKKIVGLWVQLFSVCIPLYSQVDTTYIYNTAMPYGTLDVRIAKSSTRYYYLQEDVTFSFRESAPGVKTNTFRDMTSWDSSPYREGNLREKNGNSDLFVMNYRFLLPNNYQADYEPGYPIIIMFHGLGERGNCWDSKCYWSTKGWNPNTNSPPAPTSATHNLMNNDHNLLHGGARHLLAVNTAGSKLPNDPALAANAFPGILVFPQNLNGWGTASRVEDAIRLLRLMIKKYNVDENRVYIHGLSNGGGAVFQAIKRAPWLFAAALGMSAVNNGGIITDGLTAEVGRIPLWIFQGGKDSNPTPSRTYNTVRSFRQVGADIRYYLYPNLGHGTWNSAYNEPDFFSWILSKRKYNPHVYYGNPVICSTTGAGVRISFSNGFRAYQWQQDGEIIAGASQSQYIANTPGTYRGRFSRISNPSEADWEPWSDPIVVTEMRPPKPVIDVTGTTHLRGPGHASTPENNTVVLKSVQQAELYTWYKNGTVLDFQGTDVNDTLRTASFTSTSTNANGTYTLVTSYSYCPSEPSDPVYLFFNNSAPQNISLNAAVADLKGSVVAQGVFLTWNDLVDGEVGYEVWRRKAGTTNFILAGRTAPDAISFYDGSLEPLTSYQYKLRAISKTGVSNYLPSNDLNTNLVLTTPADDEPPSPPQELRMVTNTINSITLAWQPAADNTGIRYYEITYGSQVIVTDTALTTYTITALPPNKEYAVSVKAIDFAARTSAPSNQIMASTYVMGLNYKHSTGAWTDLDDPSIAATWLNPEFTGKVNNFSLVPRTQEDYFNFQFTGYIDILTEGDYVFRVASGDGSRLMLDNALIVDNNGVHGNVTVTSDTLHLTRGPHALDLKYFDYVGSQTLTVQYKGPLLNLSFKTIPDSVLRSGRYVQPPSPPAPANLTAQGNGMQQVDLGWQGSGEVEIYRSASATGTFSIVGRTAATAYQDKSGLVPGATYFYKVRAVTATGVSAFSAAVQASTAGDSQAPSVPLSLQLGHHSQTHAAFTWSASTDNVKVALYEVFNNSVLAGTATVPAFMATDLVPGAAQSFTVRAVDASGNRSAMSAALAINTSPSSVYYSMASGSLSDLSTWKQNANGTGSSPQSFAASSQFFVISNRTQTSMGGAWSITGSASKVVIPTGVTLTADYPFAGSVALEGTATLNINHATAPQLVKISPSATVNFNVPSSIPANTYGNVSLMGSGVSTFEAGTTTITGNLTIGGALTVKGASANASTVIVGGNLTVNGAAPAPAADNSLDLQFTANATHTLSCNTALHFYKLSAAQNATVKVQGSTPIKLMLGSLNGGGLDLASGSLLSLGTSALYVSGAATINSAGTTGKIGVSGGDITLMSSAPAGSNLYFDASSNTIDTLTLNLTGGGNAVIREPAKVSGGLRILGGTLEAGGNLTLLSTATRTAGIAAIGNGGRITGNIQVQQYLAPEGNGWRDLSAPVAGATVAQWQQHFPITGSFAGASAGSTEPSMFEASGAGLTAYPPAGGSNQAPLVRARGYAVRYNQSLPVTLQVSGNPFQGDIPFTLGGSDADGWNLAGNPYASAIAWNNNNEAWSRTDISTTIAVRENKTVGAQQASHYVYYNPLLGEGTIRAGQAFWVKVLGAAPALTVTEKAKVEKPAILQPDATVMYLTITLQQGTVTDDAFILFTDEGLDTFGDLHDGLKKSNEGMFNLSTLAGDNTAMAVNSLSNSFCSRQVKLNVQNATPGNYTLRFVMPASLTSAGQVALTDHFTGSVTQVTASTAYSFSVNENPATQGSRFTVSISKQQLDISTPKVQATDLCAQSDLVITIANSQPGVAYEVLNDAGEVISNTGVSAGQQLLLTLQKDALVAGLNHVRVRASLSGCGTAMLPSEASFNFTPDFSITAQADVSICPGEQAMLQVSGTPAGGRYRWFDSNGVVIGAEQGPTLLTAPAFKETVFQVAGVHANGCESERKSIHVYVDTLEVPVITFQNDTLFTQAEATFQWKRNGAVISGATMPYFVPTRSGNYTVVIFSSGCSNESDPFVYAADPNCQVDASIPVTKQETTCNTDVVAILLTTTQPGVTYTAIDINEEVISSSLTANGGPLQLEISVEALQPGANQVWVKADMEGCTDRTLTTAVVFEKGEQIPLPAVTAEGNTLHTNATGTYQWYLNSEPIADATSATFTASVSGTYTVTITNGSCSVESAPLEFVVTATESNYTSGFALHVYPVPGSIFDLTFSVQSPYSEQVRVEIIDITGRSVFSRHYVPQETLQGVPVSPVSGPLPDGIYCVIAIQGKQEIRKRVIVKN